MTITIQKEILFNHLKQAVRFTLHKISSISSLSGGKLKFGKTNLKITTTNLNEFFFTSFPIEGDEEKTIVVDIKKIIAFLSFLPSGKITLDVEEKNICIKKNKTKGLFETMSAADFPQTPIIEGKKYLLKKTFFEKYLPLVSFATATDETRPSLTGIHFSVKNKNKYMVATDGFRLSLVYLEEEKEVFPEVTLSAHMLHEVAAVKKEDTEMYMFFSESERIVKFLQGDTHIYSRIIEESFPPFEKVIPTGYKTRIVLGSEELLNNVKLAALFAKDISNIIVFSIKSDGLYIVPRGGEEKGTVIYQEGEVEGDEQRIAFNYKFVLDFLLHAKSKKVTFEMTHANHPYVFKTDSDPYFTHIVMPVRIDDVSSPK